MPKRIDEGLAENFKRRFFALCAEWNAEVVAGGFNDAPHYQAEEGNGVLTARLIGGSAKTAQETKAVAGKIAVLKESPKAPDVQAEDAE